MQIIPNQLIPATFGALFYIDDHNRFILGENVNTWRFAKDDYNWCVDFSPHINIKLQGMENLQVAVSLLTQTVCSNIIFLQ